MDTKIGRWDTPEHTSIEPERPHDPWHDVHCRIRGRAVWDVYRNFQQRWNVARALPEIVADTGLTPGQRVPAAGADAGAGGDDVLIVRELAPARRGCQTALLS
jgi:phosphatidylserine/phosphatidylglycerophosphate/cardiolipin synthase-like enzyme